MVYIAERVPELSKTKLLKLIYLIEEISVKKYKLPFFAIPFEVWQAGPVAKTVFVDLDVKPVLFEEFISITRDRNATCVAAKTVFDESEFSDNDMEIMDYVIEKYGKKTARELVGLLHKKGSAWYKIASESGLLEAFKNKTTNTSNREIDFTYYLTGCEAERYQDCIEFQHAVSHLTL